MDEIIYDFPADLDILSRCEPIYEEFDGWDEDISGAKSFDELNENAKKYVRRIEELCGTPIKVISVGADRKQTIVTGEFFE